MNHPQATDRQAGEFRVAGSRARWLAVVLAGLGAAFAAAALAEDAAQLQFHIPGGDLADALDTFAVQSGLQIVYDYGVVRGKRAHAVDGVMPVEQALERCLAGTGVVWGYANAETIVLRRPGRGARSGTAPAAREGPSDDEVFGLGDIDVVDDPRRTLPSAPSAAAFGFDKPLLSTPRSVSVISLETIDLFGLSAVEDLVRVAPSVYTTTRWGIQGSIDIRNVPADTYFRGMKRISLQGHGRTVLGAMETMEIVRGPPSPIYGMGKIGGYVNTVPKSVRAANGEYLLRPQGFAQAVAGSYDKSELSFGVGGPLSLAEKPGGYYVYGLFEDSGSFVERVPVAQDLLEASVSVDDFAGRFRLEAGVNLQRSQTAGALIGRFTQDVSDSGRYIRGTPLVNLDADGNGRIDYLEMYERSPVRGDGGAGNLPLRQYFAWPTDAEGEPLASEDFPAVPGIPASMYDYLQAHPEADPTGALRALGPGGPEPISGYVPAGFALDPRTVGFDTLDLHRPGAFERELQADFVTAYFDLVNDADPDFTVKNQLFFDSMNQYKLSEQPFSQLQDVYALEDKVTAKRRFSRASSRVEVNGLASANVRYTSSKGYIAIADYGTHRTDAMAGDGSMTPNTTFATALLGSDPAQGGMPWTSHYDSAALEFGAGVLFDIAFAGGTALTVGARVDRSKASNVEYAGTLDFSAASAERPVALRTEDVRASDWDTGLSWTVSASRSLGRNLRLYATLAESSVSLDKNNNRYANAVIEAGHIGRARLEEAGLKASLLGNKLFFAAAAYRQARVGVSEDDDRAVLTAHASSTQTQGLETELKWVPSKKLLLSLYALHQTTGYRPNIGGAIMVDARALGFQDVFGADGRILYPAEAFLYGGRAFLVLPPDMPQFEKKQGNPETQFGVTAQYEIGNGFGLTWSGNYFSSTYAGRLKLVELPAARVFNVGLFWERGDWHVGGDVLNLFDERYFRARTGDTLGDVLVSAMPDRRWKLTIKKRF